MNRGQITKDRGQRTEDNVFKNRGFYQNELGATSKLHLKDRYCRSNSKTHFHIISLLTFVSSEETIL